MLVLTRKVDQSIMIGDDIRVTICRVRDGSVRVGVEAPDDVEIHREEIYDKIHEVGKNS